MKNFGRGFTLIELLVVVAIIGILASVVLVSLSAAKNKGADAAVKANLHTVINQAELYASDNSNLYSIGTDITGTCPTGVTTGNMFSNRAMYDATAEAIKQGGGSSCYVKANSWAVAVGLKTNTAHSWCVDNTGVAKEINAVPSLAIDSDTYNCISS